MRRIDDIYFSRLCAYTVGDRPSPLSENFAMFVLNLTTVSGCGNHICAGMRTHHLPWPIQGRCSKKISFLFFSLSLSRFIISSPYVFFFKKNQKNFGVVFDNGATTTRRNKASAHFAAGQPTPATSIILLLCMQSRLFPYPWVCVYSWAPHVADINQKTMDRLMDSWRHLLMHIFSSPTSSLSCPSVFFFFRPSSCG